MTQPISKAADGFYHPKSEDDIIALVKKAYAENLQIRCRGAAHSLAWAIYTDPGAGFPEVPNKVSEQEPPNGPNLNLMLDQMNHLTWIDESHGIVEAEAGIHLGWDFEDPTGVSTLNNSLLYQAFQKGWGLEDLGGIIHQTVGGFLSTGSSGGSLMYKLEDNLLAFRVVDGMGNVEWVEKDKDPDYFNAFGVSLGLLGIITKVRFKLSRNYFVYGQQLTTPTARGACPIDLFGPGTSSKPSLKRYLEKTPYTRILWWPQKHVERAVIWQAVRGDALPVFDCAPYEEFADTAFLTQLEEFGGALLFTLLGVRGPIKVFAALAKDFKQFQKNVAGLWSTTLGKFFGGLLSLLVTILISVVAIPLTLVLSIFPFITRWLYPPIVRML